MTKVLYIGGYGRSGSTLLDVLLGSHPDVFGGGELEMFFKEVAANRACTCGEPIRSCHFWGKVLIDLEAALPGFDAEAAAPLLAKTESSLGRYGSLDIGSSVQLFGDVWRELFASVALHAGAKVVVDSSKSSRGSARRIVELVHRAQLAVSVVHLTRDPRAVVHSATVRGNNDDIEANRTDRRDVGGVLRPFAGWVMANSAVSLSKRRIRPLPATSVRYEDLIADPDTALARIGELVGLDMEPVQRMLRDGTPMDPGHGVRGNRMRRSGPIRLRADNEWIEQAGWSNRLAAPLFAPAALGYGYRLDRWPRPVEQTERTRR